MAGLLKEIYRASIKNVLKLLTNRDYFNYSLLEFKLSTASGKTKIETKVNQWSLSIPDAASFLNMYEDIFVKRIYQFPWNENHKPKILDLGANIGLSVLFFKYIYPGSQITAVEADPQIYKYLEKNLCQNGCGDVQLINKAAWNETTTLKFTSEGADAGRIGIDASINSIDIDAIDIREILKSDRFDLLKIDIEGAESIVLPACKEYLSQIKFLFVEYHSLAENPQDLDNLIKIISDAGYRIHIQSVLSSESPFMNLTKYMGFDMQLNIFAWRD